MNSAHLRLSVIAVLGVALAACDSDSSPVEPPVDQIVGDVVAGEAAFIQDCASCHASGDGLDLAKFRFTDATIVRRALGHVDLQTSHNIVAYIRTLPGRRFDRDHRMFQPKDVVLDDDRAFATLLFGADRWPADWSTDDLLAIDPAETAAAIPLPLWSVERDNVDWMPDLPLPIDILRFNDGMAQTRLDRYRDDPSDANLESALSALRSASRNAGGDEAVCQLDRQINPSIDYERCFEVQRWISTFSAQHLLRGSSSSRMGSATHDIWWDVGQTVRRSVVFGDGEIENGEELWTSWMYAGWIFRPHRHATTYLSSGLVRIDLPRHATFMTLRSQVARVERSTHVYKDVNTAIRDAPDHWVMNVANFTLDHLLERQASGDLPPEARHAELRDDLDRARRTLSRRISEAAMWQFDDRFDAIAAALDGV